MFLKSYHWDFANEFDPITEICATLISIFSHIIALYFIDIAFIQPKKSFLKWQTWIQFIICLFINCLKNKVC